MPDAPGPDDAETPAGPGSELPPPPQLPPPPLSPPPFPPPPGYPPPPTWSPSPARSPYANFGARVGAWLIDWVLASVVGSIALLPLHAVKHASSAVATGSSKPLFNVTITNQGAILFSLLVIIYATAFTGSARGQTIGMMVVRAKAVDAVTGAPIGHARALARVLFEYLMVILLFAPWVIDMVFPLWDARRQTLHDKVTNTVVIRT
ncbi:MAG TPA: RDD family protein [Acidimicrobiales bacterium]|nr:RDD family protein [Acidimicrobiales bacterium]